ncbi:MAG: hypothetical protein MJA31_10230 [Clostridia bacterium]|nr:hypothetical protein [Clostridia bacterium]
MKIQTILGKIDKHQLGYCQCHEHIFLRKGFSSLLDHNLWIDDLEKSTEELVLYKNAGGNALVDAQPIGCGRMVENLAMASQRSGIHIIASTGFHKLIFYPKNHWIHSISTETFSKIMMDEILKGMYLECDRDYPKIQSDYRAGMIKAAIESNGIIGRYEALFDAAAHCAKKTGAAIQCHTEKGAYGVEVVKFFINKGVDPRKIIIAHVDRRTDNLGVHKQICELGAFLEYDTIGRYKYHSDEDEVKIIKEMIKAGFSKHILMGLDTTRARLKSYGAKIGLDYILEEFIPLLQSNEVSEKIMNEITIDNPKSVLSIEN